MVIVEPLTENCITRILEITKAKDRHILYLYVSLELPKDTSFSKEERKRERNRIRNPNPYKTTLMVKSGL